MSLFLSTFIFLSQRRDYVIFRHPAKKLIYLISCFQIAFARSEILKKKCQGIRGGLQAISCRHQWVHLINFIFYTGVTSHFLNICMKFAIHCSTKFQRIVERNQCIRKHIANAFQNANSALESVSNGLKKVQCIFQHIFNEFLTSLMPGFCK